MSLTRRSMAAALAVAGLALHGISQAAYPERPVKIIVPVAAGGSLDVAARLLAEHLRKSLGGSFIVENKPGANTQIGAMYVSQAAPDGYTLLLNTDAVVTATLSGEGTKVDPVTGLKPVTMLVSSPAVLVVKSDLPARTLQDFIALARTKSLNVGSTGSGTSSQFTGLMFRQRADIAWTDIPYSGSSPALNALMGGQVDAMWSMAAPLLPQIKAGKLKPVAVTSAEPSPQLPGVPTVASAYPGFVVNNWMGLFAPPGTPDAVIKRLSDAAGEMSRDPAQAAKLNELGFMPVGSSPQALDAEVKASLGKWKQVLAKQK